MDLDEWLTENPALRPAHGEAWITTLPEWPALHKAWRQGKITPTQARRYLLSVGYSDQEATAGRVIGYLGRILHERGTEA